MKKGFGEIKKLWNGIVGDKKKEHSMNNEIFNKLKEFVVNQSAVNNEEITRETEIKNDLGG